ncbi:hypothetical protein FGL88_08405 (plasmid) [Weissella soli]|nr:hypothetical protein FGL88_08405 [Weissella soli]
MLKGVAHMADFELQGMPIFVYMKEKDTNKTLQPVKLINGVLGASFKVQPATIEGYIVADIDGDLEGTFDENLHTVTFYYRDASVAQVEELTDKWLKLKADADTYKQPDLSTIPEVDGLKAASEWQIISRMVTNKGLFWHELVDGRWVLYDRKKMTVIDGSSQPAIDVPEVKAFDWTPMPFDAAATIDFVAARRMCPPLSVFTTNLSPWLTKSGTVITRPVSIVAGLPPPLAVAPLIPGCVSVTVNSTVFGTSTPNSSLP